MYLTTKSGKRIIDHNTHLPIFSKPVDMRIKQIRNELLKFVDRVNPIWYSTLTDAQISELKTYRQSLLDITLQTGYPTDIYWPEKPNWL